MFAEQVNPVQVSCGGRDRADLLTLARFLLRRAFLISPRSISPSSRGEPLPSPHPPIPLSLSPLLFSPAVLSAAISFFLSLSLSLFIYRLAVRLAEAPRLRQFARPELAGVRTGACQSRGEGVKVNEHPERGATRENRGEPGRTREF